MTCLMEPNKLLNSWSCSRVLYSTYSWVLRLFKRKRTAKGQRVITLLWFISCSSLHRTISPLRNKTNEKKKQAQDECHGTCGGCDNRWRCEARIRTQRRARPHLWAVSWTLCPESPQNAPGPAVSRPWPLLDQLDSSFLVLFRSASAHRRWGLGSSLRKDLQWGEGRQSNATSTPICTQS